MKDQLPSPDFDSDSYERPNQNWICGNACEGKPCRVGPSPHGHCRATFECKPLLEMKEGDTKGRYKCTRPAEAGGPCALGPAPDGSCCREIPKCVPVRSLRNKRKVFTISVVAATAGILLVALCGPFRMKVANPGALSMQHSTEAFAKMVGGGGKDDGCSACHKAARTGAAGWLSSGFNASPNPVDFVQFTEQRPPTMTAIDQKCEKCHTSHSFHEPNVPREHSCTACHQEHRGSGKMALPTDANCVSCHANAHEMETAVAKGKLLDEHEFEYRPNLGRTLFHTTRPKEGYTKIIHSFATDHPEFQAVAEKAVNKDPNTLKFNHELHLNSPNIQPLLGGEKQMKCADCHKPEASGVFYLKFSFEENCRKCHSLQFDVNNPEMKLPHGRSDHVRAFLRSLPDQYAEAAKMKGIIAKDDVDSFVQKQMKQIGQSFGSGEELEQKIFFSDAKSGPVVKVGNTSGPAPARFPGCAYCHQVTPSGGGAPIITPPVVPDRWLIRSTFDHSKHFKVACAQCHDVTHSRDTADILLPSKQSCVQCHSPQGGVADGCSSCHSYHSPRRENMALK